MLESQPTPALPEKEDENWLFVFLTSIFGSGWPWWILAAVLFFIALVALYSYSSRR